MRAWALRATLATAALVAVLGTASGVAAAAPTCFDKAHPSSADKPNKLYLYFASAPDSAFPEFGPPGAATSPLNAFKKSDLSSYDGSATALRKRIAGVVADAYCDLDVDVIPTTTAPPATFPRRNVVGIGSDDNSAGLYGRAEAADTTDGALVDSARVWAGRYQAVAGGPGGALNGSNSTLDRWGRSIGSTAAYAAAHNYGLTVIPGEDPTARRRALHSSALATPPQFNDTSFALIASNVGSGGGDDDGDWGSGWLHNLDVPNPNSETAYGFRITFLSTASSLNWKWFFRDGPWGAPTVVRLPGTDTVNGVTYSRFSITWSTPNSFNNGSGKAPGGTTPHVGADLVDANGFWSSILVTKAEFLGANGTKLPLDPPLIFPNAVPSGIDLVSGGLDLVFKTFGRDRLRVEGVRVDLLPRPISIDAMVVGAKLRDWAGRSVRPYGGSTKTFLKDGKSLTRKRGLSLEIARMSQDRQVVHRVSAADCEPGNADGPGAAVGRCAPGINVSLFPATIVYVRAKIVKPNAKHWDRRRRRFVTGPLTTRIFTQLPGFHPDLNRNGVDDWLDIDAKTSADGNRDGVPDEAQTRR